jgi:hypothetical protein
MNLAYSRLWEIGHEPRTFALELGAHESLAEP